MKFKTVLKTVAVVYVICQIAAIVLLIHNNNILNNEYNSRMSSENVDMTDMKVDGHKLDEYIDSYESGIKHINFLDSKNEIIGIQNYENAPITTGKIVRIYVDIKDIESIDGIKDIMKHNSTDGIPMLYFRTTKSFVDTHNDIVLTVVDNQYIDIRHIGDIEGRKHDKSIIGESSNPFTVYRLIEDRLRDLENKSKVVSKLPNDMDYIEVPIYLSIVAFTLLLVPLSKWSKAVIAGEVVLLMISLIGAAWYNIQPF